MKQVWFAMRASTFPGGSDVIISVHRTEEGAEKVCKEYSSQHVWTDGPYKIKD